MPKKIALFVDTQSLHHHLRTQHHRRLDPAHLREQVAALGEVSLAVALADWNHLPDTYLPSFTEHGFEAVQVDRVQRESGRRREVFTDLVELELLAHMIEHLFQDGGPEVDALVVASCEPTAIRAVSLVRERFGKPVWVFGIEGGVAEGLTAAATATHLLSLEPVEPTNLEGLKQLVPHLEGLEQRKRYLNFKYVRETCARKLDLPERTFEQAELLLSEAIACGLLLKQKIEDKYTSGQFFTAYALNREHELFHKFGSGDPAPDHEDLPERPPRRERGSKAESGRNGTRRKAEGGGDQEGAEAPRSESGRGDEGRSDEGRDDEGRDDEGEGKKRRRRRRRKKDRGGSGGNGAQDTAPLPEVSLAAGTHAGGKRGRKRGRKGRGNHNQDRVGRSYEAPSRFLNDESNQRRSVSDEDVDEAAILRALEGL